MSDLIHATLEKLGCVDLRNSTEGYESRCPLCDSGKRSFRVAFSGKTGQIGSFICHKCDTRGNLVGLMMRAYRINRQQAESRVGQAAPSLRRQKRLRKRDYIPPDASDITPYQATLSEWLVNRGYDEDWIAHYGIGMDSFTNEIVLPSYNAAGDLVGITRRVAEDGQAYYHWQDFPKSENLWGLNLAIQSGENCCYVVEGQSDPLGLAPEVYPCPVVSSYGSKISDTQAQLLAKHFHTVVMAYDDDPAGHLGTYYARRTLRKFGVADLLFLTYNASDPGKLPEAEEPDLQHLNFRQWKQHTNWKERYAQRRISSKKNQGRQQSTGGRGQSLRSSTQNGGWR